MRFHPALGDPEGLNERERGLFESEGMEPLPGPAPDDWLAVHPEPGQTFTDFLEAEPAYPAPPRNVLYLRPVGALEYEGPDPLDLRRFVEAFFSLEARLLPPLDIGEARITERENPLMEQRQLLAPDVLEALSYTMPDDAFCVLGLTSIDLYPEPDWNFVFGQADRAKRTGVYSFYRYDTDVPGLFLRRCLKVMAHEIGHLFGIAHCPYFRCLMNGANHLEESDARPLHLCPVDLRKLAFSVGFDVAERYRRLAGVFDELAVHDEAEWIRERLEETPGAFPIEWSP